MLMLIDFGTKEFYELYQDKAKRDYETYTRQVSKTATDRMILHKYLKENKDKIKEAYKIDLDKYTEFKDVKYDTLELLLQDANKFKLDDSDNKVYIINIIKYCNALKQFEEAKYLRDKCTFILNMSYKSFQVALSLYYNEVHKYILQGLGYKFGYGVGIYHLTRFHKSRRNTKIIDFIATRKKRKELEDAGIELYDKVKALRHQALGIPYEGVDYRVYLDLDYMYKVAIDNTFINKPIPTEFEQARFIAKEWKTGSRYDYADYFVKEINDVYKVNADLRFKLDIMLYKFPQTFINFVRDDKQLKYKYRENYSKDR